MTDHPSAADPIPTGALLGGKFRVYDGQGLGKAAVPKTDDVMEWLHTLPAPLLNLRLPVQATGAYVLVVVVPV